MNNIEYVKNELKIVNWAKCSNIHLINIIKKLLKNSKSILEEQKITNKHFAYLNMRMMLWTKCFINPKQSKEYKLFNFPSDNIRNIFVSVFNSSLHFLIWEAISDCWHITNQELQFFKIDLNSEKLFPLVSMANQLENDLENKKRFVGSVQTEYEYLHKKSKPIIDEIDKVLAKHYGFTEEELDYIINYDIKYRMGNELDEN